MARQLTEREKLATVPLKEKMIPRERLYCKTAAPKGIVLTELLDEMDQKNKGDRLPVLTDKNAASLMIHRSQIDKYLAGKAREGVSAADLKKLTLEDLLKDRAELKKLFETSWATVTEVGTLADAKAAMDTTPDCQDVFVTKSGARNEEVVGWVTNVIISDNARV